MKTTRTILLVSLLLTTIIGKVICQVAPNTYLVEFTDKNNSEYSVDSPEEFLSARAIERRIAQGIKIKQDDLPVSQIYLDSLQSLGLRIHNVSKWLNCAVVKTTDMELIDTLHHLSFIRSPIKSGIIIQKKETLAKFESVLKSALDFDYGFTEIQIKMLNAQYLHTDGYKGKNMLIAVLDAGFKLAPDLESLQHLFQNNQIKATKDFVKDGKEFYNTHTHGTYVLSIMGGKIQDSFYGIAYEANFVLLRTEDGGSEYLIEEYNWISGAEYADSIGADIINSSLGYSVFDDPLMNHTYSDMNGRTNPSTIGALMAARKGILVASSAGNEGNNSWRYITSPADADSILTVGAVDSLLKIASFSSRGPSSDGRIKPDVCAMGVSTWGQTDIGTVRYGNGTSFSSPLIAGASACLWQANPSATAQEIRQALIKSSDRYNNPDTIYGNGMPDLKYANFLLKASDSIPSDLSSFSIFPNPVHDIMNISAEFIWLTKQNDGIIRIIDLNGKILSSEVRTFYSGAFSFEYKLPINLEKGYYYIELSVNNRYYQLPFIKM